MSIWVLRWKVVQASTLRLPEGVKLFILYIYIILYNFDINKYITWPYILTLVYCNLSKFNLDSLYVRLNYYSFYIYSYLLYNQCMQIYLDANGDLSNTCDVGTILTHQGLFVANIIMTTTLISVSEYLRLKGSGTLFCIFRILILKFLMDRYAKF